MSIARDLRELISYRELVTVFARREIRARYRHSLLGAGWAVALPVGLTLIFTFVFARIAPVDTGAVPYPIFAYIGLLPWQLHANILNGSVRSLIDNRSLVISVYFAREVLPLSRVGSACFDFAVGATVLVGLMAWYGVAPGPGLLLVPLVLCAQVSFGAGLALFAAGGNLLYRDVQYVLQVVITMWMFGSAVVYPIPETGWFIWLKYVNPITPMLDAYRGLIVGGRWGFDPPFYVACGISLLTLVLGWLWFRRVERRFGELA
ncbi:MAG: ABC transporter permease [Planctomycetes bacterium]|nr:ABC transporter permease [Planctomycetota bacterium]